MITSLADLPPKLIYLNCCYNKLTIIPKLPNTLKNLSCQNNPLECLPILPTELLELHCYNNLYIDLLNPFIYNFSKIRIHYKKLYKFRHFYYSLRFKRQFRDWLYMKVREPRIIKQFHPQYLLDNLTEKDDLELVLTNWIK